MAGQTRGLQHAPFGPDISLQPGVSRPQAAAGGLATRQCLRALSLGPAGQGDHVSGVRRGALRSGGCRFSLGRDMGRGPGNRRFPGLRPVARAWVTAVSAA